jgi:hypothetical protein
MIVLTLTVTAFLAVPTTAQQEAVTEDQVQGVVRAGLAGFSTLMGD